MPGTPCLVGETASAMCLGGKATEEVFVGGKVHNVVFSLILGSETAASPVVAAAAAAGAARATLMRWIGAQRPSADRVRQMRDEVLR